MKNSDRENLNPTPEAVAAMNLWSDDYSRQNGGSMDFYESLPNTCKRRCADLVMRILKAAAAHGRD